MVQDSSTGYVSVNGLKMYYEIHGKGAPLVLINGYLTRLNNIKNYLILG